MMPFRFKNHSLKARRGEAPTTSLGRVCKKKKEREREREKERERESERGRKEGRKEGRKAGRKAGRPHNPH